MNFLITGTGEGGGGVYLVQRVVEDPGRAVFFCFFLFLFFDVFLNQYLESLRCEYESTVLM